MINKRLMNVVKESKKYIILNVFFQWLSLLINIVLIYGIAYFVKMIYQHNIQKNLIRIMTFSSLFLLVLKMLLIFLVNKMSHLSSRQVKLKLRRLIYEKLLKLGIHYRDDINTSEIVSVAVEGVDQLETYFGAYLPQLFYALLAPITLFIVIAIYNWQTALVLLICLPLIPVSIIIVNRWAKKLLAKYWNQYVALGDTFLENLEGLTTLKIYQADDYYQQKMDIEANHFRKITMKVLSMQLNSITIMDLVAFGGAAIGIVVAILNFKAQNIDLLAMIFIILLAADFFIPMRLLGSFFHIAMNGMAASKKIFNLLDLKESQLGQKAISQVCNIDFNDVDYSYDGKVNVLKMINLCIQDKGLIAIVGESGCGKSTLANLLTGKNQNYAGSIKINDIEISTINSTSLFKQITYVGYNAYLFKGSVWDNLVMANENISEDDCMAVLKKVNLWNFLKNQQGLKTQLLENGRNLSGGQKQRLALARAILHKSSVYIFDEATSNIDMESEEIIIREIYALAKNHIVILISHRLENTRNANQIYVLDNGKVVEFGNFTDLINNQKQYASLYFAQSELENYAKEGSNHG